MIPVRYNRSSLLALAVMLTVCGLVATSGGVASPWLITFAPAVFLVGWTGGPWLGMCFTTGLFLYLVSTVGTVMPFLPPSVLRDDLLSVGLVGLATSLGFVRWIRPAAGQRVVAETVRWQRQLAELTRRVGAPQEMEPACEFLLLGVDQVAAADSRAVLLRQKHPSELRVGVARGVLEDASRRFVVSPATGQLWAELEKGEPVLLSADNAADSLRSLDPQARSFLVCPLKSGAALIGALLLGWRGAAPQPGVVKRIREFAASAAPTLQHLAAAHEARETSGTDALTGLYTPRMFQVRLEEELAQARRRKHPLTCLALGVDGLDRVRFQQGDDMHGEVLRAVAMALRQLCRGGDVAARSHGDRFTILCPGLSTECIPLVVQRLAEGVSDAITDSTALRLGISLGAASYPIEAENAEDLQNAALLSLADIQTERVGPSIRVA